MSTTTGKPKTASRGSETVTRGVRVIVQPAYSSLDSDPANNYFKFIYRIRISNESDRTVQLIARRWLIVDADGERQEVQGEGVVGQQPILPPGESFEYASFCPLATFWGTMEGHFVMRERAGESPGSDDDGLAATDEPSTGTSSVATFDVRIGRFFLVCPPEEQVSADL